MVSQHSTSGILGILCLCIGLVVTGLVLQRVPWHVTVDIGSEEPFITHGETQTFRGFFVFYDREVAGTRDFRWTGERGTLVIPWALRMQPLVLEITACGCRPDGTPIPIHVLLNNTLVATLDGTGAWTRYHIMVPNELAHPDYGLMLDLRAPGLVDASGRTLGVAVDRVVLRELHPSPLTDPGSTPLIIIAMVGIAWWQRSVLLPLLLCGSWLLVAGMYEPQLLTRWMQSSSIIVGILILWLPLLNRHPPTHTVRVQGLENGKTAWHTRLLAFTGTSLLGVWLVLSAQILGRWIIDDAFVSFHYARNLVNGHGLVFNPGEYVEGYTNFLWTMLIAGAMALGWDPVVTSSVLTLLLAFIILMLTAVLAHRVVPFPWNWAAPALLSLASPLLLYTTRGSGMETALFTALILATLVAVLDHRWVLAGMLTALTMLTRPDGAILAVVSGLYALWVGWYVQGSWRLRFAPALAYSGTSSLLFGLYFAWRWQYYGYLLPNTFYAKVGSTWAQVERGMTYLWNFGGDYLLLWSGLVGLLVGLWMWRNNAGTRWSAVAVIAALTALFSLYIISVGGDWVPGARFGVPLLPLLAVLTVWGIAGVAQYHIYFRLPALAVLVLLLVPLGVRLPEDSSYRHTDIWSHEYIVRRYREVGRWIDQNAPEDTLLATLAGALPYYANRPAIDMFGLADAHIAHQPVSSLGSGLPGHEKHDADYVMGRRPTIIPYKGLNYLAHHPAREEHYRLQMFHGPEGHAVWLFVRNDVYLPGSID